MLYHITTKAEWQFAKSKNVYISQTFTAEKFIHCSYLEQIVGSANKFFQGQKDLVILEIDKAKLKSKVIEENLEGGEVQFPHLYGHLPIEAVVRIIDLCSDENGIFYLPKDLETVAYK